MRYEVTAWVAGKTTTYEIEANNIFQARSLGKIQLRYAWHEGHVVSVRPVGDVIAKGSRKQRR